MRIIFLFLLFASRINASAQEATTTFWNDQCSFETDGTGKAVGLKIKISYPCVWTMADGDRPHVVKKFSYNLGNGKTLIQSLTINKMPGESSRMEIAEMFSNKGLKELIGSAGTFISGRKVKIDGVDCGEIVMKAKRESPVATLNIFFLQYYIVYKDKIINLAFAAAALTESEAEALFMRYKKLFQALATNTIILSQW
jgi:hypothetical protein